MAVVYRARDLKHDRLVAIKVFKPELAQALGPDRFLREIKVTAQLSHPHILPLLDSGEADGLLFYVTPYVEGESLRHRLDRERKLPLDEALRITREVADGLESAHRRGVIHRDIKPENILLEEGHAVIADFGIARAVAESAEERLTGTGVAVGTPEYMSPEQRMGGRVGPIDARTDVFALACVLHELLTGEPPAAAKSPTPLPEGVDRAVRRALSDAPERRHCSAAATHLSGRRSQRGSTADAAAGIRHPRRPADRSRRSRHHPTGTFARRSRARARATLARYDARRFGTLRGGLCRIDAGGARLAGRQRRRAADAQSGRRPDGDECAAGSARVPRAVRRRVGRPAARQRAAR
ncbi:MAG: serine/threonine protein kinase [Gemmatimonadetes bacterium]|nr:MAG: serine/threonine protein kinase [Gemmatimonadota bacterium]